MRWVSPQCQVTFGTWDALVRLELKKIGTVVRPVIDCDLFDFEGVADDLVRHPFYARALRVGGSARALSA